MKLVFNHQSSSSFKVTSETSFSTVTVGDYCDLWEKTSFIQLVTTVTRGKGTSTVTTETEDKLKEKSELCRIYVAICIDQDFAI